jgi:glycosyltransferase involved in cell wall biosynthesis
MTLRGKLDNVSLTSVRGWAWETDFPDTPVSLILTVNNEVVGRYLADRYRKDLEVAGIGSGKHSFNMELDRPLSNLMSYDIRVRREGDGMSVPGSPRRLDAAVGFDLGMQDVVSRMLSVTLKDQDDLEQRLAFLLDQTHRLRQAYADRSSGKDERGRRRRLNWREPTGAAARGHIKPRALVIDDRVPISGHDAGSNAVLSHMQSLQRLGYDVTFAPSTLRGVSAPLEAEGITCCLQPWYGTIEEVLQRQSGAFALVYLHRGANAARYGALARHWQPKARLVYSVADLHFLRLARQAEIEERPELKALSDRMRLMELTAAWNVDSVITHSTTEAAILRREMRPEKVHVVPWAVATTPEATPFSERHGVAFIGGYGHQPNVDAAHWLIDAIMPEVWALDPTISCLLVGSDMPDSLRTLRRERVELLGEVGALSEVFGRVRLTVASLAFGAGIKGKVLDSMAAGLPCVCTPAAAEGFDFTGVLAQQIAATPRDLAVAIVALHRDESLNRICRDASLAFVRDFANEATVDARLAAAVAAVRRTGVGRSSVQAVSVS